MEILRAVRSPGQDMGRCDKCSHVRAFTAEEGAVYIIDKIPVTCGENVSAASPRPWLIFLDTALLSRTKPHLSIRYFQDRGERSYASNPVWLLAVIGMPATRSSGEQIKYDPISD